MALRDSMRDSAAPYLRPGEPVQAVIGAQTASQWLAALTGLFALLGFNRYRVQWAVGDVFDGTATQALALHCV